MACVALCRCSVFVDEAAESDGSGGDDESDDDDDDGSDDDLSGFIASEATPSAATDRYLLTPALHSVVVWVPVLSGLLSDSGFIPPYKQSSFVSNATNL